MDSNKEAATNGGEVELGAHNATSTPPFRREPPEPRADGTPPPPPRRRRLHARIIRKLDVRVITRACKKWLKHPAHLALLAWALCVAASATMLGLLLLGLLDGAFPKKSHRNRWIEINNQILNALFTLMSIYQHPGLFHHSVLLFRWRPEDTNDLRKAYCRKNSGALRRGGRHERLHMSVVVVLLHVTCFAQYVMCGLYWAFSRKTRPEAAETTLAVVGTATPVLAGLYAYFSPLGRKHEQSVHQEPDDQVSDEAASVEVVTVHQQRVEVDSPEWAGGLLDVGDDAAACWLSCLCTFCVFGWNMERLGFGNMYVHAVMFMLLCFSPLWVFNIAAMNIRDKAVGDMVGAAGVVLCALGLLYGGYWRTQLRRRYRLPGSNACCGSASLTDYLQWMFCWGCALAQEVRTGHLYDVEGGSVYRKDSGSGHEEGQVQRTLQPLPRENGLKTPSQVGSHSAIPATPAISDSHYVHVQSAIYSPCRGDESPPLRREQTCGGPPEEMRPPMPLSIQ